MYLRKCIYVEFEEEDAKNRRKVLLEIACWLVGCLFDWVMNAWDVGFLG